MRLRLRPGALRRWRYDGRSNLFAQATGGQGLGGYVDDLDGQAATFDQTGQRFLPQLGYAALAGAEQYLSERWRFNLIASASGIRLPADAPHGPEVAPISQRFMQLFANLIYAPTPDLLMGIEYGYYRRETNTPLSGWSHRLQLASCTASGRHDLYLPVPLPPQSPWRTVRPRSPPEATVLPTTLAAMPERSGSAQTPHHACRCERLGDGEGSGEGTRTGDCGARLRGRGTRIR